MASHIIARWIPEIKTKIPNPALLKDLHRTVLWMFGRPNLRGEFWGWM
jgi:hypothetical protein